MGLLARPLKNHPARRLAHDFLRQARRVFAPSGHCLRGPDSPIARGAGQLPAGLARAGRVAGLAPAVGHPLSQRGGPLFQRLRCGGNFFKCDPAHFKPEVGVRMLNAEVVPVALRVLQEKGPAIGRNHASPRRHCPHQKLGRLPAGTSCVHATLARAGRRGGGGGQLLDGRHDPVAPDPPPAPAPEVAPAPARTLCLVESRDFPGFEQLRLYLYRWRLHHARGPGTPVCRRRSPGLRRPAQQAALSQPPGPAAGGPLLAD